VDSSRITGGGGDTALVALISRHLDVTLLTPGRAPGVLHQPIVLTVLSTITNRGHTMIEVLHLITALGVIIHSGAVELEHERGGVDSDRNRANIGRSGLQGRLVAGFDVSETGDSGADSLLIEFTLLILSLIGIGSLGVNTAALFDISESLVHQTSVAALVTLRCGAVDQILLGKADQLLGAQEVLPFNTGNGAESPA